MKKLILLYLLSGLIGQITQINIIITINLIECGC